MSATTAAGVVPVGVMAEGVMAEGVVPEGVVVEGVVAALRAATTGLEKQAALRDSKMVSCVMAVQGATSVVIGADAVFIFLGANEHAVFRFRNFPHCKENECRRAL